MTDASSSDSAFTEVPSEWRAKVSGSLINPDTLLATDYLNHFNEVVMLIGMVADMPDLLADVQAWRPKSYPAHFREIGLDYGSLAADAYDHVPPAFKVPFETTIAQLNEMILQIVDRLIAACASGNVNEVRRTGEAGVKVLTALLGTAGGIIAGAKITIAQGEIDRLLVAGAG